MFKLWCEWDNSPYYWLRRWHQGDVTSNNVAVLDLPSFVTSVIVIDPNCSHIRTNRNCVWSIGNDHYGGSENVALKNEFKFFKLHRVYLQPFNLSNVSNFPGVEFLRTLSRFKERKGNFSSYVHVLHKTSLRIRRFQIVVVQWTSTKCTKKRDARAGPLFCS